ncbi:fumarate reductase subunit D [Gracilibacillus halotolerans]|uniref:Fumarate reductase subunit D n=1 Tax=Gracilibacillus halotolerans TaxID=74386 RepID=A0A841RNF3_9BACI|nr:hypothetical protein [Gracilibacillus halotolerans]MBB6514371.1 fumarate reductase subunit D [Gracilibacillus halotolerans]
MDYKRQLGTGSITPILVILAMTFSALHINKEKIGDIVLGFFALNTGKEIVTIAVLILALYISRRFEDHKFAKLGLVLSVIFLSMYALFAVIGLIQYTLAIF